jgi:hypothetical protein
MLIITHDLFDERALCPAVPALQHQLALEREGCTPLHFETPRKRAAMRTRGALLNGLARISLECHMADAATNQRRIDSHWLFG